MRRRTSSSWYAHARRIGQPGVPCGFTLIELLVTISIIALLVGILLPTLSSAREMSVRTKCQANLRSVHQMLHSYAINEDDHVPLGYRGRRYQWNTMVYSGFGSGSFVLFGKLYEAGLMDSPEAYYCPAETADGQSYNTPDNPWPPGTPGQNVQGGYASAPFLDWGFSANPTELPRLTDLAAKPVLADGVGLPDRVDSRHIDGVHVLFGDSAIRWVEREKFDEPLSQCVGLDPSNNPQQQMIWDILAER